MKKKKILFDAFELVHGYGKTLGIYRYAVNIFRELINEIPEDYEIIVISNSFNRFDFQIPKGRKNCREHCIQLSNMSAIRKLVWEWFGISFFMKRLGVDIYYSPKGFAPGFLFKPCGYKIVLTIHDLIPVWYAENGIRGGVSERYVVRALLRSAEWADAIMTDSETTKRNIARYNSREQDISVVHCGLDAEIDFISGSNNPHGTRYIFALGSHLLHKNTHLLLKAYTTYRENSNNPLPLVVCTRAEMPKEISVVRNLSDKEMATWYYHAECFIFPSLIEGFGFPPLEAMQYNTPVIAADNPIQREILGDACLYFNPYDSDQLANKLEMLLNNPILSQELIEAGRKRCKRYTWQVSGKKFWEVIQNLG